MHDQGALGDLELVRAFVNTLDMEDGREELTDPRSLRDWLEAHGLLHGDAELGEDDLRAALTFRECLRDLLAANNCHPLPADTVGKLNQLVGAIRVAFRFDPDGGLDLEPCSSGVYEALGHMLAIIYAAMLEGTWQRLKVCRDEGCQWAFYDHSKNRSGTWCTMQVCGSRNKARNYRSRKRAQATAR